MSSREVANTCFLAFGLTRSGIELESLSTLPLNCLCCLEWRHGHSGHLVLPSQDYRSYRNSRWRRLMTISDYKVTDNATVALIAKQNEIDGSQVVNRLEFEMF